MPSSAATVTADPDVLALLSSNPHMRALIETFGPYSWQLSQPFPALVRAVTAQLISSAAARATYRRLEAAPQLEPPRILRLSPDDFLTLGVPRRKGEYLQGLAAHQLEGSFDDLHTLTDAEVIARLVALRGVGLWTAEMVLIFSLGRPDIWPLADMGVVRAAERYYGLSSLSDVAALGERFRPQRSAAVWYLWRWIEANPRSAKA